MNSEENERVPSPPSLFVWSGLFIVGELIGFGLTALIAWMGIASFGVPESAAGHLIATAVMTLAGLLEGASIGYFQWRGLRRWLAYLRPVEWILPTVMVASFGWLIGMLVPLVIELSGALTTPTGEGANPGLLATLIFSCLFGAATGLLFGAAQWWVLRRHVEGSGFWIWGNAIGWALGLPATYVGGGLVEESAPHWWMALVVLSAAALMGFGASLGTWVSMRWMKARRRPIRS